MAALGYPLIRIVYESFAVDPGILPKKNADPGSALMITLMISLMALVFELSVRVLKAHKLSVIVSSL
jgi:hypothetical protein